MAQRIPGTMTVIGMISGTSYDVTSASELRVEPTSYQGPTGIVGVFQNACVEAGIPAISFWASVPHYVSQAEFPAAASALLREISATTGLVLPTTALDEAAVTTRAAIDAQVAQSEEVQQVVTALEEQYDAFVAGRGRSLLAGDAELPSADELGAELERFLAEQTRRGDGREG